VYTIIIARRKEANRINFLWGCGEKTQKKKKQKKRSDDRWWIDDEAPPPFLG
jgi:hypothetical protein